MTTSEALGSIRCTLDCIPEDQVDAVREELEAALEEFSERFHITITILSGDGSKPFTGESEGPTAPEGIFRWDDIAPRDEIIEFEGHEEFANPPPLFLRAESGQPTESVVVPEKP